MLSTKEFKQRFVNFLTLLIRGNISQKNRKFDDEVLQRKILVILFACHVGAFVQSCGYFIQHTAFPYLTKRLAINPQEYGMIISFTAILQLIGGPIAGRLGDVYGGRLTLLFSFVALSVCYFLQSIAKSKTMLFISRVPVFIAHALQSMYMIISDVTYEEERANVIGKLGVSHGLGMIAGSGIGGIITDKFGITSAFIVAVFVVLTCILVTFAMIPKNTRVIRTVLDESSSDEVSLERQEGKCASVQQETETTKKGSLGLKEILEVAKAKHMVYLLAVKIVSGFPFAVLGSMFTLILMDYYNLDPKQNGMVLSYLGVVGMITQGYLVGLLTEYYDDAFLILLSIILMAAGSLFLIISQSIYLFCVVAVPLTIGGSLIHIIITSLITKIVRKEQTGSALGLTLCTHATVRSISPTLGGFLFQHVGFYSFGVLGYVINLSLIIYLIFFGKNSFEI